MEENSAAVLVILIGLSSLTSCAAQLLPHYAGRSSLDVTRFDRRYGGRPPHLHINDFTFTRGVPVTKNMMGRAKRVEQNRRQAQRTRVKLLRKQTKKGKILVTLDGSYIEGGTKIYGKLKDLHSCQKLCVLSPTCFAGDYDPKLKRCFFHGNTTSCGTLQVHKRLNHFKKIICDLLLAPRGIIVLGVAVTRGLEMPGIKSLQDCIKKCESAGNGIASNINEIVNENQLCCNINFDFAQHKCYFHLCGATGAIATQMFCPAGNVGPPLNSIPQPQSISISFCPDIPAIFGFGK